MLRPNLLPILLASLFVAPLTAKSQESGVEYKIAETQPGLSAQLRPWGKLCVRLTYRSTQPVRFWIEGYAAGQKVPNTSSNIAPAYPPGEGEALVWMSYKNPTKIDEIRIEATGQSSAHPLASISVPVQLEWTLAAKSNPPAPTWFARLNREQQDRAAEAERQRPKNTALGLFIFAMVTYSALGYLALQPLLIFFWRGGWRIAALVPLVAMVPFGGMTANAIVHGSNLWPLVVMAFMSIALLYLLLLLLVRWLVGRFARS
jgi:hypothetical protein